MTEVVSFRPTDEIEEEIQRERDFADGDLSRSLAAKGLAAEAVEARNTPFWYRRDMSRRHRAQIENARDDGEDDDDVVEKLLVEAVQARREDGLDAIGASDELRELVETNREDGEALDAAVARLARRGAEMRTTYRGVITFTAGIGALMLVSVLITVYFGAPSAISAIGFMLFLALLYPAIRPVVERRLGL